MYFNARGTSPWLLNMNYNSKIQLLGSQNGVRLSAARYTIGKKEAASVMQKPVESILCRHIKNLLLSSECASYGIPELHWGERCLCIQNRLRYVPSYMSTASVHFKICYNRIIGNDDMKRFIPFGNKTGTELRTSILLRSYSQVEVKCVLYFCSVTFVSHFLFSVLYEAFHLSGSFPCSNKPQ